MGTPLAGGSTGTAATATASQAKTSNDVDAAASVTAQDLVDAFKNNGSFDALRNEILKAFTASQAGEAFAERTQKVIRDTLYDIYERPQQPNASHQRASSSSGTGIYTSPTRYGMASRSKQDATNYIYKELERHTAYERAQDSVRPFINGATRSLEDDLERLFEELTAARSAKTELKDLPGAASTDIDMKTD